MYRYVQTATRVHRVVMNGGQAFRVPLCNLSDRALLGMLDAEPPGVHCPHCWIGWEPPTLEEATEHAGCAPANPAPPPGARGTPMVEATRRLALGALVGATTLGLLAGVVYSPDVATAEPGDLADRIAGIDGRLDSLTLEVRALSGSVTGHEHAPSELVVVLPSPTLGPPAPIPTPTPTPGPSQTPRNDPGRPTIVVEDQDASAPEVTVVVRPGAPAPAPSVTPGPGPSPTPCLRPGKPRGGKDPCLWPAN